MPEMDGQKIDFQFMANICTKQLLLM